MSRSKKIYYITNSRIPTEKAHGFQISKVCESFARKGASVELIVPRRLNPIKEDLYTFYDIDNNFKIRKLPVIDLVYLGKIGFWIETITFSLSVLLFLRIPKDSIIYSRDYVSSFFLRWQKNVMAIEIHDEIKKGFIWEKVLNRTNLIISTNKLKKDKIVSDFDLPSEKIIVFPNGVDLSNYENLPDKSALRKELDLPEHDFLIGYVGKFLTMGKEKGVSTIIESLIHLDSKIKAVFVGGEESQVVKYKEQAKDLGVLDRCIFKNEKFKPNKMTPRYLKAFDVLLMPFPRIRHYEFAMSPIKMFEYMASDRPIIASKFPSIMEILNKNNSVLIESIDNKTLAEAIGKLANDADLSEQLASRAFSDVKRYTWNKRAEGILNSLENI
jgi:glycosyltransferase involved in cell wall biosynthesis